MKSVSAECNILFEDMKRIMDAELIDGNFSSPAGRTAYKIARLERLMWEYNMLHGDRGLMVGWCYRLFRRGWRKTKV